MYPEKKKHEIPACPLVTRLPDEGYPCPLDKCKCLSAFITFHVDYREGCLLGLPNYPLNYVYICVSATDFITYCSCIYIPYLFD